MSLEEEFPSIAPEETVAAELPAAELPPAELPAAELPPAELPAAELPPAELPAAELPAAELPPATIPSDQDVQDELTKIADGVVVRNRFTVGAITDTFISGGSYAPGRQRWVQTGAFDSAQAQARTLADSLL